MSTNKGNNAEDSEETLNDYYINRNYGIDPSVIVSPSSWDDSDQELTESHSSFGGESEHKTDTHYSKSNWKEDRRQSLARIRRRSRECDDSPVETRDGSQNYSPKSHNTTETKTFSCTHTKINILQFDQNWSDWDLDDIILDIESFFIDQKGPDIMVPQLNSVSITTNYYSDDESGNIHRNLNVALPRIVEITEPRQITSTGCNEVDPSKPVQNIVKHSEDNNTNQCSTVISEITPDVVIEPNNFSAENIPTTDESSRDLHQVWSGTKSKTKDKAFEQTMSYVDSEYVRNNLRYVFCDMAAPRDSMEIATISIGNDDETLNLRVSSKDNAESKEGTSDKIESEDKINVEEYNSYCTENTPGTLRMNGNISETMVNYSHPNESAGLGNLFRRSVSSVEIVYSDMEESRDNRRSQAALKCEHFLLHDSVPRSGREIFLTNICSPRKQSTFDGNEQDINYLENSDKVQLLSSTNDKEDSSEEYFYTDRIQLTSTDETPQSRGKSDISYSSSSGQDSNNHLDMSSRSDKRNDSRSSSATFRNKIILHLDLSDNDDRGSSSSTKTSTDLKSSDSSGSSKNSEHEQSRSHRLLSASEENAERTGRSEVTRSFCAEGDYPYSERNAACDRFGIGDSKWGNEKIPEKNSNFPQDRGDTHLQGRCKSEWRDLIQFDDGNKVTKEQLQNVFWVDLEDNLRASKKASQGGKMRSVPALRPKKRLVKSKLSRSCPLNSNPTFKTADASSQCSISAPKPPKMKARKRKRDVAFHEYEIDIYSPAIATPNSSICYVTEFRRNAVSKTHYTFLTLRQRASSVTRKRHFNMRIPRPDFSIAPTLGFGCFQVLSKLYVNVRKFVIIKFSSLKR